MVTPAALRAPRAVETAIPALRDFVAYAPGQQPADTARQFAELELVLRAYRDAVAALEARLAAVEAIAGNGSWDGGTP